MNLTIVTYGTWGDVLPIAALAVGLERAGYGIRLLVPEDFAPVVSKTGLQIDLLPVNNHEVMKRVSSQTHPLKIMLAIRDQIAPALRRAGEYLAATPDESDALLANSWMLGIASAVAAARGQRLMHIALQPRIKTRQLPIATMPALPGWMPLQGLYNSFTYDLSGHLRWLLYVRVFNSIRVDRLDGDLLTARDYAGLVDETPSITLVSPYLLPRPSDWKSHHRMTGFLFHDDLTWRPAPELLRFIESGPAPVYVGFGSVHDSDPERTTGLIVDALQRTNQRAVLYPGWAGLGKGDVPDSVYLLDYAPHSWLFPRMGAIVHHAGAGTTAAALRAGVPSIPVPHAGDQILWGRRLHAGGAGTRPLPKSRLSAQGLADRLVQVSRDPRINQRARTISEEIRAEDSIGMAQAAIADLLRS